MTDVRYNSWYMSVPSAAKHQREMTKFCVFWRMGTTTGIFFNIAIALIDFEFIAFFSYSVS